MLALATISSSISSSQVSSRPGFTAGSHETSLCLTGLPLCAAGRPPGRLLTRLAPFSSGMVDNVAPIRERRIVVTVPNAAAVPRPNLAYRFAAWIALVVIRVQRWRIRVEGLEHVPAAGGAVIAANHTSYWDFFVAGRGPYLRFRRPVRIMAKESLFRIPLFGRLMRRTGNIPVRRGDGRGALRTAIEALEAGELVLVLPEQTISRSFDLLPFRPGAARMAIAAGVPLVPAITWGSHRFYTMGRRPRWSWRLPVEVRYGEPLHPVPGDDPAVVTKELKARMQDLLDEAIAAYADGAPAGAWWVPARLGGAAPAHARVERDHNTRVARWRSRHRRS